MKGSGWVTIIAAIATVIGVAISYLAWQYPVGSPEVRNKSPDQKTSFPNHFSQLSEFIFEADKLDYISKRKMLLQQNIKFKELNYILSQFAFVGNRIKVMTMLKGRFDPPNKKERDVYMSLFVTTSEKLQAMKFIRAN